MMHEFRLSPSGRGRGVSCDANGAFIGAIPLLKRSRVIGSGKWWPRECDQLSEQIGSSLGIPIDMSSKMGGLKAISNALNEGNIAGAQIATVLLGIPDPPRLAKGARSREAMIKFIRDLHWSGMIKTDWNSDEHPRWPAGAPDSQGGEFAPKGSAETIRPRLHTLSEDDGEAQENNDLLMPVAGNVNEARSRALVASA